MTTVFETNGRKKKANKTKQQQQNMTKKTTNYINNERIKN